MRARMMRGRQGERIKGENNRGVLKKKEEIRRKAALESSEANKRRDGGRQRFM